MDTRTAQALIRFGLGRRGEEPLPPDPASWLHDQLRQPDPTLLDPRPSTATGLEALYFDRRNKPPEGQRAVPPLFRDQSRAELANALTTSAPFRERLVWFWTNHFTVSVRGGCAAVACAFVEEAIRRHVTGRFETMLLAVMHHPAMLIYLNNAQSVGPDSVAGQRRHLGLNENLARECMELHTVSPAAGYTQADVTELREDPDRLVDRPALRPARLPLSSARARTGADHTDGPPVSLRARRAASRHCASWPTTPPPTAIWRAG